MRTPRLTSKPKSHFNCFYCKLSTPRLDGNWVNWNEMQVHLCPKCDRLTKHNVERAPSNSDATHYRASDETTAGDRRAAWQEWPLCLARLSLGRHTT